MLELVRHEMYSFQPPVDVAVLPQIDEVQQIADLIEAGKFSRVFPDVSLPIAGKYTDRPGERLHQDDLVGAVDEWVFDTKGCSQFLIQGGNRYISRYLASLGVDAFDIKLSSIDKALISHHIASLLSPEELDEEIIVGADGLFQTGKREELLERFGDSVISSPFSKMTQDQDLATELGETVRRIDEDDIDIPNLDTLKKIVAGTEFARRVGIEGALHFLDDLFYRGRTLYTLATLVKIFGGEPKNIKLTTISCDQNSRDLKTDYHTVKRPDVLYPFENSVRTEQGFWQDIGGRYVFTDMGAYLESLHIKADYSPEEAERAYEDFKTKVLAWSETVLGELGDPSVTFPLAWLVVYHQTYGLILNTEKIVDQKGYKVGVCAPFVELLDRFVSQEETVTVRQHFKLMIKKQIEALVSYAPESQDELDRLILDYNNNQEKIDYGSLSRLFRV